MPTKSKNPMPVTVAEAGKAKARKRARRKKLEPKPLVPDSTVFHTVNWLCIYPAPATVKDDLRVAGNSGDYDRMAKLILADQHLQQATLAEVLFPWPHLSPMQLSQAMGRELNQLEAGRYTGAKMLEEWKPVEKEPQPQASAPASTVLEGCVNVDPEAKDPEFWKEHIVEVPVTSAIAAAMPEKTTNALLNCLIHEVRGLKEAQITPAPPGDGVWPSKEFNQKLAEAIMSTPSVMEAFVKDVVRAKTEFIDSLFKPDAAKADTEPMQQAWAKKHIDSCVKLAQSDWPNRPEDRKIMLGPSDRAGENLGAQAVAAVGAPPPPWPADLAGTNNSDIWQMIYELECELSYFEAGLDKMQERLSPVLSGVGRVTAIPNENSSSSRPPMDCAISERLLSRLLQLQGLNARLYNLHGRVAL